MKTATIVGTTAYTYIVWIVSGNSVIHDCNVTWKWENNPFTHANKRDLNLLKPRVFFTYRQA
jgi:hypothetical protein